MKHVHMQRTVKSTSHVAKSIEATHQRESQHGLVSLQQIIGNQSAQRLIKRKSQPDTPQPPTFGGIINSAGISESYQIQRENKTGSSPAMATESGQSEQTRGTFAIVDPDAQIREAPPGLTSNGVTFSRGIKVNVIESSEHQGKTYVLAQEVMPEGMDGPARYGWTTASNLSNNAGLIPGLRKMPDLENPAFNAVMQSIQELEQTDLPFDKTHNEEIGDERETFVEHIGHVRKAIAALPDTTQHAEQSEIKEAQAYFYRRLAPLAPYSGQMGNTNMMLSASGNAGWNRTCNMTVVSMVLEGIGKTRDDLNPEQIPLLQRVFEALEGKYTERKVHEAASDFEALRFPDFVSLVAIASKLADSAEGMTDAKFAKAVSKARARAASATTSHDLMMNMVESFGGNHTKDGVYYSKLDKIGGARKAYTKATLRHEKPSSDEKKAYDSVDADKTLAVSKYREAVLEKVNPLLDGGAQILVGMENHFVRLDALDENVIQVDDPGDGNFKNLRVSWEQARDLGYFKGFWAITD